MFSSIVSIDNNNGIGFKGDMLYHLPKDLKYFKEVTMAHTIIMGRKTYESIGHPLKGRINIVITRDTTYNLEKSDDILVYNNFQDLIDKYYTSDEEVFIIGGSEIYKQFFDYCDKLYITKVFTSTKKCDSYFPEINHNIWKLVSNNLPYYDNDYKCINYVYERRKDVR